MFKVIEYNKTGGYYLYTFKKREDAINSYNSKRGLKNGNNLFLLNEQGKIQYQHKQEGNNYYPDGKEY